MNPLPFLPDRKLTRPLLALVFATGVGVVLVSARAMVMGREQHNLVWNLFLAWLPLVFALAVRRTLRAAEPGRWKLFGAATAWLLFHPNAPYICTDLVHLTPPRAGDFWIDLVLILLFAVTGLMLGFVSLYLMHDIVARQRGAVVGWCFVMLVTGLSALGVYIGRFMRWNSWDFVTNPLTLFQNLSHRLAYPSTLHQLVLFTALFGAFLFLTYLMLYALTHLHQNPTD